MGLGRQTPERSVRCFSHSATCVFQCLRLLVEMKTLALNFSTTPSSRFAETARFILGLQASLLFNRIPFFFLLQPCFRRGTQGRLSFDTAALFFAAPAQFFNLRTNPPS